MHQNLFLRYMSLYTGYNSLSNSERLVMKQRIQKVESIICLFAVSVAFLSFSGCVKTYKFLPEEFPQGEPEERYDAVSRMNVRSLDLYNEYKSEAHFDFLWFSSGVREAYVDVYARKRGLDPEAKKALQVQHDKRSKDVISLYVLVELYEKPESQLSDRYPRWNMYLETVRGSKLLPDEIKEVELAPEIRLFFGDKFSIYKTAYLVTFPARDMQGRYHVKTAKRFKAVISSAQRKGVVRWGDVTKKKKKKDSTHDYMVMNEPPKTTSDKRDEDFYWI